MEEITSQLLRPGTFAVAVMVVIATFFLRRIMEGVFPSLKKKADENSPEVTYENRAAFWWNTVVLYAIPVVAGMLFGLVSSEFLHGSIDSVGGRVMFQGGIGWFSSFLYKIFRKLVLKKTGVDINPGSIKPPSMEGDVKPEPPPTG